MVLDHSLTHRNFKTRINECYFDICALTKVFYTTLKTAEAMQHVLRYKLDFQKCVFPNFSQRHCNDCNGLGPGQTSFDHKRATFDLNQPSRLERLVLSHYAILKQQRVKRRLYRYVTRTNVPFFDHY